MHTKAAKALAEERHEFMINYITQFKKNGILNLKLFTFITYNLVNGRRIYFKKKPSYPVNSKLKGYLKSYKRDIKIPVFYDDLTLSQGSVVVYDKNDEDTLWIRVYYSDFERENRFKFKKVLLLHSDGNDATIPFKR